MNFRRNKLAAAVAAVIQDMRTAEMIEAANAALAAEELRTMIAEGRIE